MLFSVGLSSGQWISCDILGKLSQTESHRGDLSFTLFKVTYSLRDKTGESKMGSEGVGSFYDGVFTTGVYQSCVAFIFISLATIILALLLAVLNMLSLAKHPILGPNAMLVFNIAAILFGAIGDGLFAHLYLNDMDDLLSLDLRKANPGYTTSSPQLGYSFWLIITGTIVLWGAVVFSPLEKREDRSSIQKAYLSHVTNAVFMPNTPYHNKGDIMLF
jgi:ABC-type spermidine/putrescine transport system permease subunit II